MTFLLLTVSPLVRFRRRCHCEPVRAWQSSPDELLPFTRGLLPFRTAALPEGRSAAFAIAAYARNDMNYPVKIFLTFSLTLRTL
jgi:hypothetical protein